MSSPHHHIEHASVVLQPATWLHSTCLMFSCSSVLFNVKLVLHLTSFSLYASKYFQTYLSMSKNTHSKAKLRAKQQAHRSNIRWTNGFVRFLWGFWKLLSIGRQQKFWNCAFGVPFEGFWIYSPFVRHQWSRKFFASLFSNGLNTMYPCSLNVILAYASTPIHFAKLV